jgi:hypothetical protein
LGSEPEGSDRRVSPREAAEPHRSGL